MRSHKKTPFLIVLVAIFVLVSVSSCGRSGQNSDPESIEKWILATSVSIREEFSPETFIQLKDAGIDYAELGLRAPQFYADSSVREEFCRQVKGLQRQRPMELNWSLNACREHAWETRVKRSSGF